MPFTKYFAQMHRLSPVLCFAFMTLSCSDLGNAPAQGWLADYSSISDPAKRWQAYAIEDYSMLQAQTCFCADGGWKFLITVQSGRITGVVDPADGKVLAGNRWGAFRTIDDLFALVKSIDTTTVASLSVSYDARYGYPLRVFIDPSTHMADEEYGYETEMLEP
jgi:hypothetical protein